MHRPIRKTHVLVSTFFAVCCLFFTSSLRGQDQPPGDAWDQVLAAAGLTKATCRFDQADMALYGGADFRLSYYDDLHDDPLRIPSHAKILRANLLASASAPADLVTYCGIRVGYGTRRTLIGDPLDAAVKASAEPGALLKAIQAVHAAAGTPMTAPQQAACRAQIGRVPADVQRQAALMLYVERDAYQWRQRALAAYAATHSLPHIFAKIVGDDPNAANDSNTVDPEIEALMHAIDMPRLMAGGEDLTLAADRVSTALAKRTGQEDFSFDWDTPLGHIALHGARNDTYPGDIPYLLILDTGGDDTYYGGGGTFDAAHPVSVLIDLAGNDKYLEAPELAATPIAQYAKRKHHRAHPCFGAGVLGYGVLIDNGGNDLYRAVNETLGRGHFGMGVLVDRAGNDTYDAYSACEGSADFGVGVLDDLGGADNYHCFLYGQGYGGPMGFGLLCDSGADPDVYEANDTVIDFGSPQTKDHNANLSQGCGNGWRADFTDGHSLAGGIGVLVDGGGDNHFTAGLFAQGAGYWYGVGFLSGGPGNDTYDGVWYVQGSAAHFAVGILDDVGGDDRYRATMNMAQGAGHDFSVGFLIDEAGNDRYEAPNLSLGGGNANGFGFFWDKSGRDTYVVHPSTTLGRASIEATGTNSVRERDITLGIFLDTGGEDTYPADIPAAHNNARWTIAETGPKPPLPVMRGAGLDIEAPNTPDPK